VSKSNIKFTVFCGKAMDITVQVVYCVRNVVAHGDAREGK